MTRYVRSEIYCGIYRPQELGTGAGTHIIIVVLAMILTAGIRSRSLKEHTNYSNSHHLLPLSLLVGYSSEHWVMFCPNMAAVFPLRAAYEIIKAFNDSEYFDSFE